MVNYLNKIVLLVVTCLLLDYCAHSYIIEKSSSVGTSWSNCGPDTDPIRLAGLSVSPDPIALPGNVALSVAVNISKPFPPDLHANVGMRISIFSQWLTIPCEGTFGSCNYTLCSDKISSYVDSLGNNHTIGPCPAIPTADYSISNLVQNINKTLPIKTADAVQLIIDLTSNAAGHIGCFNLVVNATT